MNEGKQLKKLEKLSSIDIFIHYDGVNVYYNRLPFWKLVKLIGFWNAVKHKWRRIKNENDN